MSEQRRILNLMKWMELLKKDIELQQQMKSSKCHCFLPFSPDIVTHSAIGKKGREKQVMSSL